MANEVFGALVEGAKAAEAELIAMDKRVDLATIGAIKKVQSLTRARVRSRLRGRARWNHRGQGVAFAFITKVDINGGGSGHVNRSGGPGRFTGTLNGAVRASRKPRLEGTGTYSGVVFMGSKVAPVANVYKAREEANHPYFAPGVNSAKPKMPIVWEKAWAKATETK
jgi:hypothetical protein